MPRDRLHVNLQAALCTDLVIDVRLSLSAGLSKRLRESATGVGQSTDGPWLFGARYTATRTVHHVLAFLRQGREDESYGLHVHYRSEAALSGHPRWARLTDLFSALATLVDPLSHRCVVDFRYRDEDGEASFPLPVSFGEHESGSGLELRGLRLSLPPLGDSTESSIIVDRPSMGAYYHTLAFTLAARPSDTLPERALSYASQMSGLFFHRVPRDPGSRKARG